MLVRVRGIVNLGKSATGPAPQNPKQGVRRAALGHSSPATMQREHKMPAVESAFSVFGIGRHY
jgi:hypothetical protein